MWTATSITVTVPGGITTGNVVVTVDGVASNGMLFTVVPSFGATGLSDSMGRVTIYGYQAADGSNFVTSVAGSGCASCGGRGNTGLTYDALGNLLTSTDALNNTTSYTYDSMGNVLTKTQYLNASTPLTWTYTYNSFQEVLTATDPPETSPPMFMTRTATCFPPLRHRPAVRARALPPTSSTTRWAN